MSPKPLLKLFCLFVLTLGAHGMDAQTKLHIEQKDNPKFSIPLSEVRKLTFSDTNLVLHPKENATQSFTLIELSKVHFKDIAAYLNSSSITSHELAVFPNPTSQFINVEYELAIPQNISILISNIHGHVMQKHQFIGAAGFNRESISVESLKSGVYILQWQAGNQSKSTKLLIQ